jgi:hypothetical protein
MSRCAKRAVAIQLGCFVAALLAMTVFLQRDVGITASNATKPEAGGRFQNKKKSKAIIWSAPAR